MPIYRTFSFPDVVLSNPNIPSVSTYLSRISTLPGLVGWWDLFDQTKLTLASGKVQNVAAKAGAGNLAQATAGNRPTLTGSEVIFSAASSTVLTFDGTHPAADHSVAFIIRHGPYAGITENIGGVSSPTATRHSLALLSTNTFQYAVNTRFAQLSGPALIGGASSILLLLIADYVQSTGIIRLRVNSLPESAVGGVGAASLLNAFNVGSALSTGANGFNGTIFDTFLFSQVIIGTDTETTLNQFATEIRGVTLLS